MSHDDLPYIKHILDAINDIELSIKNLSKEEFKKSRDTKDATVRRIEVIGEAVKNISKWTKNNAYFNVDLDITWDIVKKDLPDLKKKIKIILEEESFKESPHN